MINKSIFLVLSFLMLQPMVSNAAKKDNIHRDLNEKKFVRAFNQFKKLSEDYPTSEESIEKMREIIADIHDKKLSNEEVDKIVVDYLQRHPRLLRKAVRVAVLGALKNKLEDEVEASASASSGAGAEQEVVVEKKDAEEKSEIAAPIVEEKVSDVIEDNSQKSEEKVDDPIFEVEKGDNIEKNEANDLQQKRASTLKKDKKKNKMKNELKNLGIEQAEEKSEASAVVEEKSDAPVVVKGNEQEIDAKKQAQIEKKKARLLKQLG